MRAFTKYIVIFVFIFGSFGLADCSTRDATLLWREVSKAYSSETWLECSVDADGFQTIKVQSETVPLEEEINLAMLSWVTGLTTDEILEVMSTHENPGYSNAEPNGYIGEPNLPLGLTIKFKAETPDTVLFQWIISSEETGRFVGAIAGKDGLGYTLELYYRGVAVR